MFPEFQNGTGYTFRQDARGITLDILSDESSVEYPFRVSLIKEGTTYRARVNPGTANNMIPKIGSTYLDDAAPPTITLSTGRTYICLKTTYSSATFFPDQVEVVAITSEAGLAATNTNGYLVLASVNIETVSGVQTATLSQYIFSSQLVIRSKPGSGTAVWLFNSR
jgi:hypothetical protein